MAILEARLRSRDSNNLDFLRCLAAVLVILSHCFPLLGQKVEPFGQLTGYETFGQLGVTIFFFMSGLLITRSWDTGSSAAAFLRKRALRILPALAVSVLLCVFVVGPLCTTLPLADYLSRRTTYRFLLNAVFPGYTYWLAGVFTHNPNSGVNGSMWTLPMEYVCYGAVLGCGLARVLTRRAFPWVGAAVCGWILWSCLAPGGKAVGAARFYLPNNYLCYSYFLLGAAAYVYRHRVALNGWLALLAAALYIGTWSTGLAGYAVSFVTVPYVLLYVAFTPVSCLRGWARHGDLSYGLYIYAFPVQQTLVFLLRPSLGIATLCLGTIALTLPVAWLSWHLVERPALRWRPRRGPRIAPPAPVAPALPATLSAASAEAA